MLGHELSNPLSPILNAVELIRLKDVAIQDPLALIERQARHLSRLMEDLMDASRVAQGKVELRKQRLPSGRSCRTRWKLPNP